MIYKIDYKDVGIHFNFKMQLNYLQSITEKKDENTRKALETSFTFSPFLIEFWLGGGGEVNVAMALIFFFSIRF